MNEAVSVGRVPNSFRSRQSDSSQPHEQRALRSGQRRQIPEPAPERPLASQSFGVPGMPQEAGWRVPHRGLVVQAGGQPANLAIDIGNTLVERHSVLNRSQLLPRNPVKHVNLALTLEALDVKRSNDLPALDKTCRGTSIP